MALALEAAIPLAPPSQVGRWVETLVGDSLAERTEQIAGIERLVDGGRRGHVLGAHDHRSRGAAAGEQQNDVVVTGGASLVAVAAGPHGPHAAPGRAPGEHDRPDGGRPARGSADGEGLAVEDAPRVAAAPSGRIVVAIALLVGCPRGLRRRAHAAESRVDDRGVRREADLCPGRAGDARPSRGRDPCPTARQ